MTKNQIHDIDIDAICDGLISQGWARFRVRERLRDTPRTVVFARHPNEEGRYEIMIAMEGSGCTFIGGDTKRVNPMTLVQDGFNIQSAELLSDVFRRVMAVFITLKHYTNTDMLALPNTKQRTDTDGN